MKLYAALASTTILGLGLAMSPASADVIACSDPASIYEETVDCGTFIETRSGNNSETLNILGTDYHELLKIEFEEEEAQSGTWGPLDFNALFMVIKAGNSFSIYGLGPDGASSGEWATAPTLLVGADRFPNISHLSFYGPKPVSEPALLALFGAGLLGMGLVRTRRRS